MQRESKEEAMAEGVAAKHQPRLTRRTFLQGAAAAAGLVAGSGLMTGVPTIWAQRLKDITLLQVGGSYSAIF
jgi:putative spermidine/putrescine transport system substrate-binding protein